MSKFPKIPFEMQQKFNEKVNEQHTVVNKTRIIFLLRKYYTSFNTNEYYSKK